MSRKPEPAPRPPSPPPSPPPFPSPGSCNVDKTPSEIRRKPSPSSSGSPSPSCAAESIRSRTVTQHRLNAEWLDGISTIVRDCGIAIPANNQRPVPTIYRVPRDVRYSSVDYSTYNPAFISIGPYSKYSVQYRRGMGESKDHKWRCVNRLIARHETFYGSDDHSKFLIESCLVTMKTLEYKIRSCYSEEIEPDSDELALLMMLDGCFILTLLLNQDDNNCDFMGLKDGPMCGNLWIWHKVKYDLLLLENQIPLFVIQMLFDLLRTPKDAHVTLVTQSLKLFSDLKLQRADSRFSIPIDQVHHLLHLFYLSINPCEVTVEGPTPSSKMPPNWIPCATELQDSGIKFRKKTDAHSFFDIKFRSGIMEIPPLEIDDYSLKLFGNLIAFEQCYPDTQCQLISYATFMDCVINGENDMRLLHLNGIITDRTGIDHGARHFFRSLCKNMCYASDRNYLNSVMVDVTEYQDSKWHKWRASLTRDYFKNPWAAISVYAAAFLLLLAMLQTIFTMYPVIHK